MNLLSNDAISAFLHLLRTDNDSNNFPSPDDSLEPETPTRNLLAAFNREYGFDGSAPEPDDNQVLIRWKSIVPPKRWVRSGALGNEKAAPQLMDLAQMIGNACKDRKSLDTAYNSMIDIFETLVPANDPCHSSRNQGGGQEVCSYPQTEKRKTVKRKKPIGETKRAKASKTKSKPSQT